MAYRYEGDELVIDGWERGISDGPYSIFSPSALGPINQTGTLDLSYGNILGIPGEFSVQFPLKASTVVTSGGLALGTPCQKATNMTPYNSGIPKNYYMLDGKGQVFISSETGGTVTWTYKGRLNGGNADVIYNNGLVWWQGYLFAWRDAWAGYSHDDGATWTDWSSVIGGGVAGLSRYAMTSKVNDAFYFCFGNQVGSVILTPGTTFDPTNAATYTATTVAVQLPIYDTANCLEELNGQILIGGSINRVYVWDANNFQGTGVTSLLNLPLFLGDNFVQRIVTVNANAYIFTSFSQTPIGTPTSRGNIYVTNGSTIDLYKKIPDMLTTVSGTNSQVQTPYWQVGDAMYHRNMLIFSAIATDNITGSAINGTAGVWAIDLSSQVFFRLNQLTGDTNENILATVLNPYYANNGIGGVNAVLGMGYFAGSVGAMYNSTTTLSTSARVITDKIPVGTKFKPKTFGQLELKCAVALVSGESIDVTVITDQDPGGKSIGTMSSTDGMSKVFTPLNLFSGTSVQGLQWLQVKCVLNPTNTNPTFVRLREIRLR